MNRAGKWCSRRHISLQGLPSLPSFPPFCLLSQLRLQHGSCEAGKDSTVETREEQNVLSVAQLASCPSHSLFKLLLCQHSFPFRLAFGYCFICFDARGHSVCACPGPHTCNSTHRPGTLHPERRERKVLAPRKQARKIRRWIRGWIDEHESLGRKQ